MCKTAAHLLQQTFEFDFLGLLKCLHHLQCLSNPFIIIMSSKINGHGPTSGDNFMKRLTTRNLLVAKEVRVFCLESSLARL